MDHEIIEAKLNKIKKKLKLLHHTAYHKSILSETEHEKGKRTKINEIILSAGGIEHLTDSESDHGRLSRPRLGLSDHIPTSNDRNHGSLLNRRGFLESIRVNPSEQVVFYPHPVESGNHLYPRRCFEHKALVV
jgi:hypothetical protein